MVLSIGVSANDACICRKAFAADQAIIHASPDRALKHFAQDIGS
jgi:hypothetical protein